MSSNKIRLFINYIIDNLDNLSFFKEHPEIEKDQIKSYLRSLIPEKNNNIYMYTDGASRGNPGLAGAGFVIYSESGETIKKGKKFLGKKTNNEAEYLALILALKSLSENKCTLNIFSDSELMVKQLNGEYKVKNEKLKPLFNEVQKLLENINYKISHIKRDKNKIADKLANEAIDEREA
jgi:ribonuclease HI